MAEASATGFGLRLFVARDVESAVIPVGSIGRASSLTTFFLWLPCSSVIITMTSSVITRSMPLSNITSYHATSPFESGSAC